MTSYDAERQCLIVRIVFDGPALAGKTTNLRQLCELFPVEKRSEMYTPGSLKGRTMFFDWLEVDGGKKGERSFRFQLLTVPGQIQRNYRRRPLIEMADVVVFVCDSNPDTLEATQYSWSRLRSFLRKRKPRTVPLVVQANKQDHPEALTVDEVIRILKLGSDVPVIRAMASTGDGIKETITTAMKLALKEAQHQIADGLLASGALGSSTGSADDLFMAMLELEDNGEEEDFDPDEEESETEAEPTAETEAEMPEQAVHVTGEVVVEEVIDEAGVSEVRAEIAVEVEVNYENQQVQNRSSEIPVHMASGEIPVNGVGDTGHE